MGLLFTPPPLYMPYYQLSPLEDYMPWKFFQLSSRCHKAPQRLSGIWLHSQRIEGCLTGTFSLFVETRQRMGTMEGSDGRVLVSCHYG